MTEALVALLGLTAMEIVLGIDNVVFIAIVAARLPGAQQQRARQLGLVVALGTRILLLFTLKWMMGLTKPFMTLEWLKLSGHAVEISGKSLILLVGGLFLIGKSTHEIHNKLEGAEHGHGGAKAAAKFAQVLVQIALLDLVFSLDSVITAVGMARDMWVMVLAMTLAMGVMLFAAGPVSDFVNRHPTVKVLALSFLLLIGVMLVSEGFGQHINKGYIYFAMAFSLFVEMLNLRMRAKAEPVHLHGPTLASATAPAET